jgi:plastocyanin
MHSKAGGACAAVLAVIALLLASCGPGTKAATTTPSPHGLPQQQFAAHYVDSAPVYGKTFALVPDKVLINFDFSLAEPSAIAVAKDGKALPIGTPTISGPNSLHLSSTLPSDAGDGLYVVNYKACWPDRSCHDGRFAFTVNSKTKASYLDMTGKKEVQIEMQDIKFQPEATIISKGTKVTWTNRDSVTHFVNTDPHPSHNVLRELNSLDLNQGQSYNFTFNTPGEWSYHCSAHFPAGMVGRVIVQP